MSLDKSYYNKPELTSPCVECVSVSGNGYSTISLGGVHYAGHRLVYMLAYGPIPQGSVVRHKCDNTRCINPLHLELGTHTDNMRDSAERGTHRHGEDHANAKLNEEIVRLIRKQRAEGKSLKEIAAPLGLHITTVSQVANRKTWRHVL